MKAIEISYASKVKELEKLNARLERAEKAYEKKLANAVKFGVDKMTDEEHSEWLKTVPTVNGWIVNKADIKKNGAWFDLFGAEDDLERVKEEIRRAEARFEKAQAEVEQYHKEMEEIADLQKKEELMKREFEQEQKEWAKDGITLQSRYTGLTPNGKRFWITGNNGWTNRSLHCFTLTIEGKTIFTSGEFWRAYAEIKRR